MSSVQALLSRLIPSPSLGTHPEAKLREGKPKLGFLRPLSRPRLGSPPVLGSLPPSKAALTIFQLLTRPGPLPTELPRVAPGAVVPRAFSLFSSKPGSPLPTICSSPHTDLVTVPLRATTFSWAFLECSFRSGASPPCCALCCTEQT